MSKSYWMEEQKGNFTKDDTFDPKKRFIGVRLQQGVPLLDRDWNELEDIRRYEEQMLRKYYIGDGSPDNGFKINAAQSPDNINNFRIGSGRCLVDGFDVVNEPPEQKPFINYTDQKLDPLAPPTTEQERVDTVYLDVWIIEVRSPNKPEEVEDKENFDSSLKNTGDVNVETSVRHRLVWLVRVHQDIGEYDKKPTHHYYDIAKITRKKDQQEIKDGDIQDLRKVIGGLIQKDWINVDFQILNTGWDNNNKELYNSASYFRDTNGIVHLRGSVKHLGGEKKPIFNLPDGYKPDKNELHTILITEDESTVNLGICKISDNGDVLHLTGDTVGVFLDGITFRAKLK